MKVPVGEWIQKQRLARDPKVTQADVARACKTDVGNVSRWERGIVVPKAEAFRCICELFGIKLDDAYTAVEFVAANAPKKGARAVSPDEHGGADSHESGEYPAVDAEPAAEHG